MPRLLSISAAGLRRICKLSLIALCLGPPACRKAPPPAAEPPQAAPAAAAHTPASDPTILAAAYSRLATLASSSGKAAEAATWYLAALNADPADSSALENLRASLLNTRWHFPSQSFSSPLEVSHLAAHGDSLWLSLNRPQSAVDLPPFHTTIRWSLAESRVAAVLFPSLQTSGSSLTLSPNARFLIATRQHQNSETNLLCHAESLKPIINLGPFPAELDRESLFAFSPDELLIAHPQTIASDPSSLLWHIRDSASGQILRSEPISPLPAAAKLEHQRLRILHFDGSITDIPISPIDPIQHHPAKSNVRFTHAIPLAESDNLLTINADPRIKPEISPWSHFIETDVLNSQRGAPPTFDQLLHTYPQSIHSRFWAAVQHHPWPGHPARSLPSDPKSSNTAPPTYQALTRTHYLFVTPSNEVHIHHLLPSIHPALPSQSLPHPAALESLNHLTAAITGLQLDPSTGDLLTLTPEARLTATQHCQDPQLLSVGIDSKQLLETIEPIKFTNSPRSGFLPLWQRLATTQDAEKLWPQLLKWSDGLGFERWHQDLSEAVLFHSGKLKPDPNSTDPSPWRALITLNQALESNDHPTIETFLANLDGNPITASTALLHALEERQPAWISTILNRCPEMPPTLQKVATVRLLWCQDRKAEAITLWPEPTPSHTTHRQEEDWLGWELVDFSPIFQSIQADIRKELDSLILPPDASPELRTTIARRLLDPATESTIGKARLAELCVKAAIHFADLPDESETTFQLANLARRLGAPAEPCLRAEALSLTSMGNFTEAHPRWIILLTQHPPETHLPGDYSEAAYTAFEKGDPAQATEILATGIKRFPNDAAFAIRAGWIALLTGNPHRAYDFLLAAETIGIPDDQLERATALLAIAAYQSEFAEESFAYYEKLLLIDESWAAEETINALEWPEELKATLIQLAWQS